jgi:hypothetical protein
VAEFKLTGNLVIAFTVFIKVTSTTFLIAKSMVISPYSARDRTEFLRIELCVRNFRFGLFAISAQPPSEMSLISKR